MSSPSHFTVIQWCLHTADGMRHGFWRGTKPRIVSNLRTVAERFGKRGLPFRSRSRLLALVSSEIEAGENQGTVEAGNGDMLLFRVSKNVRSKGRYYRTSLPKSPSLTKLGSSPVK